MTDQILPNLTIELIVEQSSVVVLEGEWIAQPHFYVYVYLFLMESEIHVYFVTHCPFSLVM